MKRLRRAHVLMPLLVVVVGLAGVAFAGSAGAKEVGDQGPFALVPRLDGARPPSFVGVDSAGRLVGVALTAEGELVAYVCDGEKTGAWFTGTFTDNDATATLKGKKGASLTLDLAADPLTGSVTIGGTEETFTLAPAVGSAGLYRERHGKRLSGWVVANNGSIWGITEDSGGKVVATVQVGGAPPPSTGSGSSPGSEPVQQGFFKCALAQFRLEREGQKLANHRSSGGSFSQAENNRNAACDPTT